MFGDAAYRGVVDHLGHAGERRAEREIRDKRDPGGVAVVKHAAVVLVQQAVGVLNAGDLAGYGLHLGEWRGRDTDASDLALIAQGDHLSQLILDRDMLAGRPSVMPFHTADVDRTQ